MTDVDWTELFAIWWPQLLGFFGLAATVLATVHVLLTKRQVQARAGWVGLVWLAPIVGSALYLLLGINRIRRRAVAMHRRRPAPQGFAAVVPVSGGDLPDSLRVINRVINQVTRRPVLAGNRIIPFDDGRAACEAMLAAINAAQHSISFCTYIFDTDAAGLAFIDALAAARRRGVEVRVLVDAVGLRYSLFDPADRRMAALDIPVRRFLPPRFLPTHLPYANLRNHRKIMVVDGTTGFTGGMNVRAGYLHPVTHPQAIQDLHFELQGPVVAQLQRSFLEDWLFMSGEELAGDLWFPPLAPCGDTLARGISDGPDEDYDKLFWSYMAGINGAQKSLYLLTPYFLPEPELTAALQAAAMRGVDVNIVLPEHSNLPLVDWASTSIVEALVAQGCRVWLTRPPFDHGKLFLVDDAWALIGSANWDPRSLRLNFEFGVECYDPVLGRRLRYVFEQRLARARLLSRGEFRGRHWLVRLRDGFAGLFTPYL